MRSHLLLLVITVGLLIGTAGSARGQDASPHYDKDQVTAASKAFLSVAADLQEAYLPLEQSLSRTDSLLAELDLNLALSKGAVDAAQHKLWSARLDERSGVFGPEFEAIQLRIQELEAGFEVSFQGALDRALTKLKADGVEPAPCAAKAAGIAAMAPGFASGKAKCPGEDVSLKIASMWDNDPQLTAQLAALIEPAWPGVTSYSESAPSVATGGFAGNNDWLSPANLGAAIPEAIELIDAIERMAAKSRNALRASYQGLDREAPGFKEQRLAVSALAKGIRSFSEDAKKAAGEALFESLNRVRRKGRKAGWSEVTVCLNPTGWEGCSGTDRTDDVAEAMVADRKLQKALAKLLEGLEPPSVELP